MTFCNLQLLMPMRIFFDPFFKLLNIRRRYYFAGNKVAVQFPKPTRTLSFLQ